jgi:hypothetical protein
MGKELINPLKATTNATDAQMTLLLYSTVGYKVLVHIDSNTYCLPIQTVYMESKGVPQ